MPDVATLVEHPGPLVLMITCRTCRHWKRPEDRDGYQNVVQGAWRGDTTPSPADEADRLFGECTGIEMGPAELPNPPLAVVMDGSNFMATLFTQADFGCVFGTERADPPPESEHPQ